MEIIIVWTKTTHQQYKQHNLHYTSDLTNPKQSITEPMMCD